MRHEFKFVVDGADLTKEQQATVAEAIAAAGVLAMTEVAGLGRRDSASFIPVEWLGRILRLLDGEIDENVKNLTGVAKELAVGAP